jgi:hypothetical protein
MQNLRSRTLVALLAVACAAQTPAQASNDGKLCDGIGILFCIPLAAAVGVVDLLAPRSAADRSYRAVDDGDVAELKRLFADKDNPATASGLLSTAVDTYIGRPDSAKDAGLFAIIEFLVTQVDVSGTCSTDLLQKTISNTFIGLKPDESWPRRLAVAKLLFARGARADRVELAQCQRCDIDNDLLPLMVRNGANPSRATSANYALLHQFISSDRFDAAERLLRLGANPNGDRWQNQGMLVALAQDCDRERITRRLDPAKVEAAWQACVAQSTARIAFAIEHGADSNGEPGPASGCITPYEAAQKLGNHELAETLLKLGADPGFGARCRAGG